MDKKAKPDGSAPIQTGRTWVRSQWPKRVVFPWNRSRSTPVQTSSISPGGDAKIKNPQILEVEDFPQGYPRFTNLISAHSVFSMCRRFSTIRARLLLMKQDRLSILEAQLQEVDRTEARPIFLGSLRRDNNLERKRILTEFEVGLLDYDKFVANTRTALDCQPAKHRDITSLQNWIDGNGCLSREETLFLHNELDLMALSSSSDETVSYLETCLVKLSTCIYKPFCKNSGFSASRDRHVHIFRGSLMRRISQTLIACLIVVLLLVPVIIVNTLHQTWLRLLVIAISAVLFITTMSVTTSVTTRELFLAGATYSTVLVVFVAGGASNTVPTK